MEPDGGGETSNLIGSNMNELDILGTSLYSRHCRNPKSGAGVENLTPLSAPKNLNCTDILHEHKWITCMNRTSGRWALRCGEGGRIERAACVTGSKMADRQWQRPRSRGSASAPPPTHVKQSTVSAQGHENKTWGLNPLFFCIFSEQMKSSYYLA